MLELTGLCAGYGDLAMDYRIAAIGTMVEREKNRRAAG